MSVLTGTFTVDANSEITGLRGIEGERAGRFKTLYVAGTFGSGTVKLQASPDAGTTKIDVPGVSLSANGMINFQANGDKFYLDLSGSTSPSLTWWVF